MIGSLSKKYVFFHCMKAAGTSIINTLKKENEVEFGRHTEHLTPDRFNKLMIEDVKGHDILKSFTTFAFVRNPWDLHVSVFKYMKGLKSHFQHNEIKDLSFDEYVEWRVKNPNKNLYDFLSLGDESVPNIKFIGKFEYLNSDFDFIMKEIGINVELSHDNKTKHKHYTEYYNENTKNMIEEVHQKDIEHFGYTFDNKGLESGVSVYKNN